MVLGTLEVREPHVLPGRRARSHLLTHAVAHLWGAQHFFEMLWPTVVRPLWDNDEQARAAKGIGIAVEGDVHALFACIFDQTQHARGATQTCGALVEVRNVNGNAAVA